MHKFFVLFSAPMKKTPMSPYAVNGLLAALEPANMPAFNAGASSHLSM